MILTTLACVISSTGCYRPSYADIYETLQEKFKSIYGSDSYIDPDSQDGQMLAVVALAQDDANAATEAAYNSYSPATAQSAALSSNVKINGIARNVATNSTVTLTVTGNIGTFVTGGVASDAAGNRWLLEDFTIGGGGTASVAASCEVAGAIGSEPGTIVNIETPAVGWASVTNAGSAQPGSAFETDAALRQRQAVSVALPSKTVLSGLKGAILDLANVTRAEVYENDTGSVDSNGIAAHSIAVVTVGGAAAEIADAVMRKKTPGTGTHGATTTVVDDLSGQPISINHAYATVKTITIAITVKALSGYSTTMGDTIKQSLAGFINSLGIGKKVDLGRLYLPAQLYGNPGSETYEVDSLQIAISPAAVAAADAVMAYNEIASTAVGNITLTVT